MRNSQTGWRTLLALLLVFIVAAPGLADDAFKKKKPRRIAVRRFRPRSGRTFVNPESELRILFSRPVDPETIRSDTIGLRRVLGDEVPWTFRMERRNRQVVLIPLTLLVPGADHQIDVRVGVRGARGQELRRARKALFYTDPRFAAFQFLRPEQFVEVTGSTMVEGRAAHSASLLQDSSVLLAGGQSDFVNISNTGDRFYPSEDRFRVVGNLMSTRRAYHVDAPIAGSVLLIGGWDGTGSLATTEIYDTIQNGFRPGPTMVEDRDFVAAVALDERTILVVGGLSYQPQGAVFSDTAEIYEVSTGRFRLTKGSPVTRRAGHQMTLLDDGRVLITGGQSIGSSAPPSAEIFDPVTETFRETHTAPLGRRQLHTATVLTGGGAVLIADGGSGRMELFDPRTERFFEAGGASSVRRTRATATLLPNNEVLIAGGFDERSSGTVILDGMDLYQPTITSFGRVVRADVVFAEPRAGHTATSLVDQRVLFAGGFGSADDQSLNTGIVFTPD